MEPRTGLPSRESQEYTIAQAGAEQQGYSRIRNAKQEFTERAYDTALRLLELLYRALLYREGWVALAELPAQLHANPDLVDAARKILDMVGVVTEEERVGRKLHIRLHVLNTNWWDIRLSELILMHFLRGPLWQLIAAALQAGEYAYEDIEILPGPPPYIRSRAELREHLGRTLRDERTRNPQNGVQMSPRELRRLKGPLLRRPWWR